MAAGAEGESTGLDILTTQPQVCGGAPIGAVEEDGRKVYIGPPMELGPVYKGPCFACWLPFPPTQNTSIHPRVNSKTGKSFIYHGDDAKVYFKQAAEWIAATRQGPDKPFGIGHDLMAFVYLLRPSGRRFDVDNRLKKVFDALNKVAYEDDYQIQHELITSVRACDVKWKPPMPELMRIPGTDSCLPSVYVEVVRRKDVVGFLVV